MSAAVIRIQYADGRVEDRTLALGTYRIGRDEGEIVLHDSNVSGRHAELHVASEHVFVSDTGSTNGSFDSHGNRILPQHPLRRNEGVRFGNSTIWLIESYVVAGKGTQVMNQFGAPPQQNVYVPAPALGSAPQNAPNYGYAAGPAAVLQAPAPTPNADAHAFGDVGPHSHPDQLVRHSYPVVQSGFGLGAAAALLMKTAPFLLARLAILAGLSFLGLVYWLVVIGGFVFLVARSPMVAWGWLILTLGFAGWLWRAVVRYFLYLLKAAHIAVLTELITKGEVANGSMGMFAYGKRVVQDRFGQVNVLFAVDLLVDGVVRAFNRTLDWVGNLLPIPGLDSVVGVVKAVLRASTTYIDETIFSYNLARGDANVYRSSKDGLIYYAQNSREILKTGVWVVILEKVLSAVVFVIVFVPALAFAYLLPDSFGFWLPLTAILAGLLFAADVQQAILRPLFLTMIMVKFHSVVRGQAINAEWDQRLEGISGKFRELKTQAESWVGGSRAPSPVVQAAPAE